MMINWNNERPTWPPDPYDEPSEDRREDVQS
jgi:hypothetical protein